MSSGRPVDNQQTSTLSSDDVRFHEQTNSPQGNELDKVEDCVVEEPSQNPMDGSFLSVFFGINGAPQLLLLALVLSLATGPIFSAVPDVVEDRYARLLHQYEGPHCSGYDRTNKPAACVRGGDSSQNAAAKSAFVQNVFILLSSSVVGGVSDCRGRKGFLAFSLFLSGLAPIALLLLQLVESMNPFWYYAADASNGLVSTLVIVFSMISDIIPPSHRAPSYGLVISAYMLGFALSQLLAFFLGHVAISILAVALLASGCLFALAAMPETVSDEASKRALARRRAEGGRGAPLRPIREMSILGRDRFFRTLSAVAFCSGLVYTSDRTLIVYYAEDALSIPYRHVAAMFFVMALLGIALQVFVLGAAIRILGEKAVLVAACACGAAHNLLYGIAASRGTVMAGLCVSEFTALAFPVQISMRSNNVDEAEQGRVQGAFQSLAAVADAIGPVTLQFIFHRTEDGNVFGPGTMFLFAALVYFIGGIFACSLPLDRANVRQQNGDDLLSDDSGHAQEPLLSLVDEPQQLCT